METDFRSDLRGAITLHKHATCTKEDCAYCSSGRVSWASEGKDESFGRKADGYGKVESPKTRIIYRTTPVGTTLFASISDSPRLTALSSSLPIAPAFSLGPRSTSDSVGSIEEQKLENAQPGNMPVSPELHHGSGVFWTSNVALHNPSLCTNASCAYCGRG
mmetsp:Transcript_6604/g.13383  ORF Transcript_6604/g.13383 Transcript_6604/m.13383 type:complete len:161 (-) Transcript_6604:200-682(-)|eukprot:CAMPEP_0171487460 /NCGR_PEP_ID=MMETSP0958-20121227/1663_1 /TAXON_ID=87120 /ORGANISM="Aurantiochytrium limacinum, Strain ATCCMYA-1381" /LENGTH=160 /DNA_ID=CAMNT_0012020463 /DNA_START=2215 /DNA_END=2697 /DNA_ORIENTATION=+